MHLVLFLIRVALMDCARRDWRPFWAQFLRPTRGRNVLKIRCALGLGARLFAIFTINSLLPNMDVIQRCTTQQARVASFLVELLSTTTSFIVAEDVEIRMKAPLLQRLDWDKFVVDYQNKPLFRRHLRMTYTSFTKLLDCIRELLEVDDAVPYKYGPRGRPPRTDPGSYVVRTTTNQI
jgi:hypothetical protein